MIPCQLSADIRSTALFVTVGYHGRASNDSNSRSLLRKRFTGSIVFLEYTKREGEPFAALVNQLLKGTILDYVKNRVSYESSTNK